MLKMLISLIMGIFRDARMRCELRRIYPTCHLYPNVAIDRNSTLGDFVVLFNGVTVHNSSIGDHSYIQKNAMISDVDIGRFCSIASDVSLGLPQHSIGMVSTHPAFYLKNTPLVKTYCEKDHFNTSAKTVVGHDVWIGQNALVMSGVRIGNGAIIGAGAVVTKDVKDYEIVAGVPARHIRYRFDDNKINALLKIRWWDMTEKWREENQPLFLDVERFVSKLDIDSKG